MTHHYDAIVVGAGVIGLFTARVLRRSGRRVLVLDRGEAGCESSRAGGGILSPLQPWRETPRVQALAKASQQQYPAIAGSLLRATGIDVEYLPCGALYPDAAQHAQIDAWAAANDVEVEVLEGTALRRRAPSMTLGAARFLPGIAQIRNPRLLSALIGEAAQLGIEIRSHSPVRALEVNGGEAIGVRTDDGPILAEVTVIAAGAWSASLLAPLGVETGIYPARGQMLWYAPFADAPRHLVLGEDVYIIPRRDGVCLVGSTVEDVGFEKGITREARTDIARRAARLVPALASRAPAGQWCGLRPAMRGDGPRIGAVPGLSGLFMNSGHFRNGITLAPASARELLRQIEARGRGTGFPL